MYTHPPSCSSSFFNFLIPFLVTTAFELSPRTCKIAYDCYWRCFLMEEKAFDSGDSENYYNIFGDRYNDENDIVINACLLIASKLEDRVYINANDFLQFHSWPPHLSKKHLLDMEKSVLRCLKFNCLNYSGVLSLIY